jgi:DNA topoisomerase I
MSKKLLIVESPAKAKTIEKFLGADFVVRSSYGHVRDLEKNGISIDLKNGLYTPNYVVSPEKFRVVNELKTLMRNVDEVWLATDEDREGEAISWHLCEVLGLDPKKAKRIVFHEITKPAIQKAVQNPRSLDLDLVNAQQARRVLDRLVGYELSEILWKKIKGNLSAGRVQSVAVKLVVEREREIRNFNSTPFFKIEADFLVKNQAEKIVTLKAESPARINDVNGAENFLKNCIGANYTINNIVVKPVRRKPAPPFTTSTLQQEASRKLGMAVNRTMQVAQVLYEQGHITYMRTDSVNMSELAIQSIAAEIERVYGKKYVESRRFKTKNESAQEAHEAIRPTYFEKTAVSSQPQEQKLYELIWKRAMASQMSDAELERTVVDIEISTQKDQKLVAEGEVLKFDGFLKVYLEGKDEGDEDDEAKGVLPPLSVGQKLDLDLINATERFTRSAARFSEAALVKKLEELGIGRPSTYAPTISKIMEENRGYVVKESREGESRDYRVLTLKQGIITKKVAKENTGVVKNALFPTDMGILVSDFLEENFETVMDYGFTAGIEKQFDGIAEGKADWPKVIDNFYQPFHSTVEKTLNEANRVSGERILGKDPESGRTVLVRMSKFGKPVIQIGAPDELAEGEKPRYGNLRAGGSLETLTIEEALDALQLPKNVGQLDDIDMIVSEGRYGPYIKFGEMFVSLAKGEDPYSVNFDRAVELVNAKRQADAPIFMYKNVGITKGTGRFGPFIKYGDLFINIPVRYNIATLTEEQAHELIETKLEKEANRFIQLWADQKPVIAVENGRWGPFIRFGKDSLKLMNPDGSKLAPENANAVSLEEVKKMIEMQMPGIFDVKAKAKPAAKDGAKTAAKKPAAKSAAKKPAAKK